MTTRATPAWAGVARVVRKVRHLLMPATAAWATASRSPSAMPNAGRESALLEQAVGFLLHIRVEVDMPGPALLPGVELVERVHRGIETQLFQTGPQPTGGVGIHRVGRPVRHPLGHRNRRAGLEEMVLAPEVLRQQAFHLRDTRHFGQGSAESGRARHPVAAMATERRMA